MRILINILIVLFFVSCSGQTLLDRAKEGIVNINNFFPYIEDVTISDTAISYFPEENLCFIDFSLGGHDRDGNQIQGRWTYLRTIEENGEEIERISPKNYIGKDTIFYKYPIRYPQELTNFELMDENMKNSYLKYHNDGGVKWFELIVGGKHGIVRPNGAIVEPAMYDSISFVTEGVLQNHFILYYTYNTLDDKKHNARALSDSHFIPIIPACELIHSFMVDMIDEASSLYWYLTYRESSVFGDGNVGATDANGTIIFPPIYKSIIYVPEDGLFVNVHKNFPNMNLFYKGYDFRKDDYEYVVSNYYINPNTNKMDFYLNMPEIYYYSFIKRVFATGGTLSQGDDGYKHGNAFLMIHDGEIYFEDGRWSTPYIYDYSEGNEIFFIGKYKYFNKEEHDPNNKIIIRGNSLILEDGDETVYYKRISENGIKNLEESEFLRKKVAQERVDSLVKYNHIHYYHNTD